MGTFGFRLRWIVAGLAVFLWGGLGAAAQTPSESWTRIAVLDAHTTAVCFSPEFLSDKTVFAATKGQGIWRSEDAGNSWVQSRNLQELVGGQVNDLVISPNFRNDGTLFAITEEGAVYKCTNGGGSFTFTRVLDYPSRSQGSFARGTCLAIHPQYSSGKLVVFAGYEGGQSLWYTLDGGTTWVQDGNGKERIDNVLDLAISPNFSVDSTLYVAGYDNGGGMWERVGLGSSSWTPRFSGLGTGIGETVTAVMYLGNGALWAGTATHGYFRSTNYGAAWTANCDGTTTAVMPRVNAIVSSLYSSGLMVEARNDGPYESIDSGATCVQGEPWGTVLCVAFQPSWNGSSRCYSFYGTPSALIRKTCSARIGTGPDTVDARSVALAKGQDGMWIGSQGQGLFKSVDHRTFVRYNAFPNRQVPQVVKVRLAPGYKESSGVCGEDTATLFAAVNFPESPADNGVYRSRDFGNTWTKLTLNWPSGTQILNDLAVSPAYQTGNEDQTLYAATMSGLYRWNGDSTGWSSIWRVAGPVFAVGLPPSYNAGGATGYPYRTVFAGGEEGNDNGVWYSNNEGASWIKTGYLGSWGRVTAFAFPNKFGIPGFSTYVWASAITLPASPIGGAGGVYMSDGQGGYASWAARSGGLGSGDLMVWDIAGEPALQNPPSNMNLLCATDAGIFKSPDAAATWYRKVDRPAFALAYDLGYSTGKYVLAGLQTFGAVFSSDAGSTFDTGFKGYGSLPDDVWASTAHDRDGRVLFSASPSMGVFVSEDGGVSFRPWNRGKGGSSGPCVLTSGLGIAMLSNRRGANLDAVWVGTLEEGIKVRYTYYNPTTGVIDLETENGSTQNGWRHNTWYSGGALVTGRWERIEAVPGTGQDYPVWATGQAYGSSSAQGFAALPAGNWYTQWRAQNTGLPALSAGGVRQGYASPDPVPIASGQLVGGTVQQNAWKYYSFQVPAGTGDFRVFLDDPDDGGPIDPDLYVRYGALPTTSLWDYRPYINGDETVCVLPAAFTSLSEDFDGTWGPNGDVPPTGWLIYDYGDETIKTWNNNDWHKFQYDTTTYHNTARVYYAPVENQNELLVSPLFSIPEGAVVADLEFDHYFREYSSTGAEHGKVYYFSTQHPITLLADFNATTAGMTHFTQSLLAYRGDTEARLLFQYTGYNGWYWIVDNVKVSGTALQVGTWYMGVRGYSAGASPYELTATLNTGCTAAVAAPEGFGKTPEEDLPPAAPVPPGAPAGHVIWGTVNGASGGVYLGTGDPSGTVTWEARNGVAPNALTNLMANTVLQLSDSTVVVGCQGDVFTSPAPDEGRTTWVSATDEVAAAGSNDFRDLLAAANGDLLIAANGTGTGSSAGGVWLSGDGGAHWMNLSKGFDAESQELTDILADARNPPTYYSSTDGTGVYKRTITASPYPSVSSLSPSTGTPDGGTTVTLSGSDFSGDCPTGTASDCPGATPVVLFGDVEVTPTSVDAKSLTAKSPPHAAGSVTVRVRNADTRLSAAGRTFTYACAAPASMANNAASDLDPYADTGVRVTWTDPGAWGDGASGTRSFAVTRNGITLVSNLSPETHAYTDTTGVNGTTYTYRVRATNGCGQAVTTAGASAADAFLVPVEVPTSSFKWSGGTKTTLAWSAATGASTYRVYRGDGSDVGDLPSGASVCLGYDNKDLTTGAILTAEPAAGTFYYYLVVATNGAGEGTPGTGRILGSTGACSPP